MWAGNRVKQMFVLMLLLPWLFAGSSAAQQVSAGSPAVQTAGEDANKSAAAQGAGAQTQPPASQEKSSAGGSQLVDDPEVPSLPGAKVRVLKEGEKVPERKDENYEDWRKPQLTPGMKMAAIPLGTAKGDGFTRELWRVQWRELDPIDLWVVKPASVKKPAVILYLYSVDGSNERYKSDEYCKFVTRNGIAAVGFVSALVEQRFHDRPMIQTFVSELQESLGTTTHDIQMILTYMEKRGDLDTNRVGMWADGSGAGIAIMASAVDARIKALDLLDPWGDWPDWVAKSSLVREDQRGEYLKPFFLLKVVDLDPLQYFPKVKAQKVRLQYIKEGISVTPAVVREKMEAVAPPNVEVINYENKKAFLTEVTAKGTGLNWIMENVAQISHPQSETQNAAKASDGSKDAQPR
jgi:hypothetical protein